MTRSRNKQASPEPVDDVEEQADGMKSSQGEDQGMKQPLQFDEALTWRSGKPIPVADLLRRLKDLSAELVGMEQGEADSESMVPKAQELVHTQILDHRDKGVRAHAMFCIVAMIRILAPDAPFKSGQLKKIFTIFISSTIPALADPSDPYSEQHKAVLISLHTIRSIVLLTDVQGSESLILTLFTNCFDLMSGQAKKNTGEKLPKNVEHHVTGLLCVLVDEMGSLPSGVIEIILAQFLRADPNAVLGGSKKVEGQLSEVLPEPSPAYNMARAVCNTCADRIVHAIAHYFSSVLVDATQAVETTNLNRSRGKKRTHDESEDESDHGLLTPPAEEDLKEAQKAHRLLRELWRACPDITRNVIPQMEAELRTENVHLREMAVQTIGDMVAGIGAAGPPPSTPMDPTAYPSQSLVPDQGPQPQRNILLNPSAPIAFSSAYPITFQAFTDRHKDKAWQVRSAFVTAAGRIILTSAGGKGLSSDQEGDLLRYLSDLLVDIDEHVRLAAVQVVSTFDYNSIVRKLGSLGDASTKGTILHGLADRVRDRKHTVRIAAMELLGRLWGVGAGNIAEGSERTHDLLGPIPSKILDAMYLNEEQVNALVQRVLFEYLLPINFPPPRSKTSGANNTGSDEKPFDADAIRAERILVLVRDLDEDRGKKILFALQQRQPEIAKYLEAYLKACEASHADGNDKANKKRLDDLISYLDQKLTPNVELAAQHLKKFAKHHDRRSYQLIRFCFSPQSDYRKIINATKELTKRLNDAPSDVSVARETLLPLVRSASILVYNKSHVPAIVDFARTNKGGLGSAAHTLLKEISIKAPEVFKIHVNELCDALKKQVPGNTVQTDTNVVDTLKACAGFARRFPEGMPKDKDFYKAMVAFANHGQLPKTAKYAVTVIVSSAEKKDSYIKQIQEPCVSEFKYGSGNYLSKLAAISQIRLLANRESEPLAEKMMSIAIEQVLTQARTSPKADDPEWSDNIDDDLSAKLWALRILVNGLRGLQSGSDAELSKDDIKTAAAPVYRLLNTLLQREGELGKDDSTPKHHKSRLRLAAAVQLLKLSCNRSFDQLFTPADFNRLSKIAQDPLPEIRAEFLASLKKHLGSDRLPSRFYSIVFMYAWEPDKVTEDSAVGWLKARAASHAKAKDTVMEATFARFLSMLAHHPDFSAEAEDLQDFVKYILFYLKTAATQENLPIIYHIAQRLKSVQDGIDPAKSENLYVISDLAEAVIRHFQEIQGWSLQLFSGKAGLPSGIFARLPSHQTAQQIADKRYLPEDFADDLENIVKTMMKSKKRKSEANTGHAAKKVKSTSDATPAKKSTTRKAPSKPVAKPSKTPKRKAEDSLPSSDRRKSARVSDTRNYAEPDTSDDEADGVVDEDMADPSEDEGDGEVDDEQVDDAERKDDEKSSGLSSPAEEQPAETTKEPAPKKQARGRTDNKTSAGTRKTPQRAGRTRGTARKAEKDIMDVPSDSE